MEKLKAVDSKKYIALFIILSMCYSMITFIVLQDRIKSQYNLLHQETTKIAKGYSNNLSNAANAKEIISELLEEKLYIASESIATKLNTLESSQLDALADEYRVDDIHIYNPQGVIVKTNVKEYIGWKAFEGHPVYNFMTGNSNSLIEEIRPDTESGVYFKYGYYKLDNGSFVQIGIRAEKIHEFLNDFEIQNLIRTLKEINSLEKVLFIDNELRIVNSTDYNLTGVKITNPRIKEIIEKNQESGFIAQNKNYEYYQFYQPINFDGVKIGTLAIYYDTESIRQSSRLIIMNGLVIYLIVLCILGYIVSSFYSKSKRYFDIGFYDKLSNLPNKHYFEEYIKPLLAKSDIQNQALIFINIKNFSAVNISYGYAFGDEVIKKIALNLKNINTVKTTLFRMESDRFLLFVENYTDENEILSLIAQINNVFSTSLDLSNSDYSLTVELGIVKLDEEDLELDRIMKNGAIALKNVKRDTFVNYVFFNKDMEEALIRQNKIERELRKALAEPLQEIIYVEFQPQVDIISGKILGFEALARMKSEDLGHVSPMEFIPIAEEKLLIVELGNFVLKKSCEFIKTLNQHNIFNQWVAINISAAQILRSDFVKTILGIIEECDCDKSQIELEITESLLIDNFELVNNQLDRLRRFGIKISLDDFGTGYSSFSMLEETNIDKLKIDRSFINRITEDNSETSIAEDIISMAHKLGLTVIAEGVESQNQKNYLSEHECDIAQGYYYSKPVSLEKAINMATNN